MGFVADEVDLGARLEWTESQGSIPALRARLAPRGRVLIESGDVPLLVGRVDVGWEDASLLYAPHGRPMDILPPWTAGECRRIGADTQQWFWTIQRRLQLSPRSPLHRGSWSLSDHPAPWAAPIFRQHVRDWLIDELVEQETEPDGSLTAYINYFRQPPGGAAALIPLRRLSSPDAPRVKAHRRLAREGLLAPVTLLRMSGLGGHVILDGHDRLVAAMAEDTVPRFACLSRSDAGRDERASSDAVAAYESAMASIAKAEERFPGPPQRVQEGRAAAAKRLGSQLSPSSAPTWAWPLTVQDWEDTARSMSPDWQASHSDD